MMLLCRNCHIKTTTYPVLDFQLLVLLRHVELTIAASFLGRSGGATRRPFEFIEFLLDLLTVLFQLKVRLLRVIVLTLHFGKFSFQLNHLLGRLLLRFCRFSQVLYHQSVHRLEAGVLLFKESQLSDTTSICSTGLSSQSLLQTSIFGDQHRI